MDFPPDTLFFPYRGLFAVEKDVSRFTLEVSSLHHNSLGAGLKDGFPARHHVLRCLNCFSQNYRGLVQVWGNGRCLGKNRCDQGLQTCLGNQSSSVFCRHNGVYDHRYLSIIRQEVRKNLHMGFIQGSPDLDAVYVHIPLKRCRHCPELFIRDGIYVLYPIWTLHYNACEQRQSMEAKGEKNAKILRNTCAGGLIKTGNGENLFHLIL
ncbi:MAG: hypothetical protein A4E63_00620 [Syntrophorhabdus sp. PtaU1.Bin050]|nr:MAG: hypothetical protein A4E63_00620 [Syntrophorhabdus sp. PtaU1.Bin050]